MDEEKDLEWEKLNKANDDMINMGKMKALNDNKKKNDSLKDIYIKQSENDNSNENYINENYDEDIKTNKLGIISIVFLALLLFIVGIYLGNKLLLIDEKPVQSYKSKETLQKSHENSTVDNIISNTVMSENASKTENEDEEEVPIVYAQYKIKKPNENNKECTVSFGKAKNFSISLGKNNAYIYGEYHIDGNIITCNALTWRNSEKQEIVNTTIKYRIINKNEIQVSEVNIFDGTDALDKELINLDGLRVGTEYAN